jgi:hypothetical protein
VPNRRAAGRLERIFCGTATGEDQGTNTSLNKGCPRHK